MKNSKKNILKEKLKRISSKPGVYLMKDKQSKIIYIGKAKNLKKRLSSYFNKPVHMDIKTGVLVQKITDYDTIITISEQEALLLESTLIKKIKPKYNIVLKDDKRYKSLRINIKERYPYITVIRKIKKDGALYFGPFPSATSVNQTLKVIHKTFKLRKCKTRKFQARTRPCLNYQMGTCLAPCCNDVNPEVYREILKEVSLFLNNRTPSLIKKIKKDMIKAGNEENYEIAAELRDKLFALIRTLKKQIAITTDFIDRDIVAIAKTPEHSLITIVFVRGGFMNGTQHFSFSETLSTNREIIETFIRQFYEDSHFIPKEILVPLKLDNTFLLEKWLYEKNQKKVTLHFPVRGEKKLLIKMAAKNAENELKERIESGEADRDLLKRLQIRLGLQKLPGRIECFDNSNISGTNPVSGMIVFKNGKPEKSSYRKYKIKTVKGHDDYAYMSEVLTRRYKKENEKNPFPDLLMVDGGKGQLNIAISIIKTLEIEGKFEIIGIAKKDETKGETTDKIYKPQRANHINFGKQGDLVLFLERIRDEAHRFAIIFHRKQRSKQAITSIFDPIPGVGIKIKKALLKHFGGISKIKSATLEEINKVPGMNKKTAESVYQFLKNLT